MIYTAKTHLIRVKINRHNYDEMCHVQSKPVKKIIKTKLKLDVAELGLAQTQLVFCTLEDKNRAPTRTWAQGPHMVKSIPAKMPQ